MRRRWGAFGGQGVDAKWLRKDRDARRAIAVILPNANRKHQRRYDADARMWRDLVETYFEKSREFREIPTGYDKADCSYTANWNRVATLHPSRWMSTNPRISSIPDSTGCPT
jgi:hypothetical protein